METPIKDAIWEEVEKLYEKGIVPPDRCFEIDHDAFLALLKEVKYTRQTLRIKIEYGRGIMVNLKSEKDPDDWLPMSWSDNLH